MGPPISIKWAVHPSVRRSVHSRNEKLAIHKSSWILLVLKEITSNFEFEAKDCRWQIWLRYFWDVTNWRTKVSGSAILCWITIQQKKSEKSERSNLSNSNFLFKRKTEKHIIIKYVEDRRLMFFLFFSSIDYLVEVCCRCSVLSMWFQSPRERKRKRERERERERERDR